MIPRVLDSYWPYLFGDHAGEALMQRKPQDPNALPPQAKRCGKDQVCPIRIQQVCRTNFGLKSPGDQRNHVHQRFGGFASLLCEVGQFFQC